MYLFDAAQDDAEDEQAAALDFVREYGFRFERDAVVADGPDAFWARCCPPTPPRSRPGPGRSPLRTPRNRSAT